MTVNNAWARVQPFIDFTDGPWVVPASTAWTDVSPWLRADSAIKVTRGRSNEFSKFGAGRMTGVMLDNRDRKFDSGYTGSPAPYNGNINPSKQTKLQVEYPWLPGLLPDGSAANSQVSASTNTSMNPISGTQGYLTGSGAASYTITGTSAPIAYLSSALPWAAGEWAMLSCRVMCSRAGAQVQPVLRWGTGVGNTLISSVTGSTVTCTNAMQWYQAVTPNGSAAPATTQWLLTRLTHPNAQVGDVWYVDAIVVDAAQNLIQTSLFYGYVDGWTLKRPTGRDSVAQMEASDAFASFSVKDIASVGYESTVESMANLRHYWSMSERADYNLNTVLEDAPGTSAFTAANFVAWGLPGPALADLSTAAGLTEDATNLISGWMDFGNMLTPKPNTGWTLGFWVQMTAPTDRFLVIGPFDDPAAHSSYDSSYPYTKFNQIQLYVNDQGNTSASPPVLPADMNLQVMWYDSATHDYFLNAVWAPPATPLVGGPAGSTVPGSFYDGAWHFVVLTRGADNRTWNIYTDGVNAKPTVTSGVSYNSSTGQIDSGPQPFLGTEHGLIGSTMVGGSSSFTGQLAHVMVLDRAIAASEVSTLYNLAQNAWFGQSPASRVSAVLQAIGFPTSMTNLDTGNAIFDAQTTQVNETNTLEYLQYIEDSENGWLFMDKSGNVRLIARQSFLKPPYNTAQWVFGDLWPQDPTQELPLSVDVEVVNSNTLIYTEGEGSRVNGDTLYLYSDNTTMQNQGKRTISKSNLLNWKDQDVIYILQYLLAQYKNPKQRIQSLTVEPYGSDELWNFVLNAELGQACQINLRPPPASAGVISYTGRITGIDHDIGRKSWKTKISLSMADLQPYLVLNDPVRGKLSSGYQLAY